jgi:hypothetical protein
MFFPAKGAAKPCGCNNMAATSDSSVGTCAVREYRQTSCELLWGPEPNAKEVTLNFHPRKDELLSRLSRIGASLPAAPDTSGGINPELEGIRAGDNFWKEVDGAVSQRSQLSQGDLYVRALALLAQKNEVAERPHIAVGGLIFVLAAGLLSYSEYPPEVREAIVTAILANRQRFLAFTREASGTGEIVEKLVVIRKNSDGSEERTSGGAVLGFVRFGCAEIVVESLQLAAMVKTQWASTPGRRCKQ